MKDEPTEQPHGPEEELARLDDRIVGKAFNWSAVVFVVLAVLAAGAFWYARRKKPTPPGQVTALTAPVLPPASVAPMPAVKFSDVTAPAGIHFSRNNGAYGEKLLPETMGGGVAFADLDDDGAPDLLFVNGTSWPWDTTNQTRTTLSFYRNDGKGHFTDATAGSGLDVSFYGMGVAIGDFDNDGLPDVLVTGVGENRLFRNAGHGKFTDVTQAAGIGGEAGQWSSAACFFDYDNDGRLDLAIGHYVKWSREIDAQVGYKIDGRTRAYGQPMNFEGSFVQILHNEGNGTFRDASAELGVQIRNSATGVPAAKTLGLMAVDVDSDGYIDLVVANDTTPNLLFHNEASAGGRKFKECGAACGVAFDSYGNTRGAMGIDAAHYRNDASLGVVIGNFANEMSALYVSQGAAPSFTDEAITEGIGPASRLLLKFGVFFFDYDLDGRLDVLTANGHLDEEIVKLQRSQSYRQPAQLFWNTGAKSGATFVPADAAHAGPDLFKPIVGRGSAFADLDGDGDPDVVLTQPAGPPLLLRNEQQLGNHWLRVKLVGTKSNRSAIGARLVAHVGNQILPREVNPARGYLSASELPVTFGLGKESKVDAIDITWPSGTKQTIQPGKIDAMLVIEEPKQ